MSGWRQAVFIRHRRIDAIQRALSNILDDETWSPATPRRLRVGSADASSRGWTMILPELANFFLDRGGAGAPRLCRLASELRCPAYEVDVRNGAATTLFEVDALGALRISGSPKLVAGMADIVESASASRAVGFGLLSLPDDIRDRIDALRRDQPDALADYLGALAGFPAWTRLGDDAIAAGELAYEPPRISTGRTQEIEVPGGVRDREVTALAAAGITAQRSETRGAIARPTPRAGPPAHDRRGTRPRSASRPRR